MTTTQTTMTASSGREYLVTLCATETGRAILRDLGYTAILDVPDRGDDCSTIRVATEALTEFRRRYPMLVEG